MDRKKRIHHHMNEDKVAVAETKQSNWVGFFLVHCFNPITKFAVSNVLPPLNTNIEI